VVTLENIAKNHVLHGLKFPCNSGDSDFGLDICNQDIPDMNEQLIAVLS
jgi:hypothetical protein